jgi:hypothetical protein
MEVLAVAGGKGLLEASTGTDGCVATAGTADARQVAGSGAGAAAAGDFEGMTVGGTEVGAGAGDDGGVGAG